MGFLSSPKSISYYGNIWMSHECESDDWIITSRTNYKFSADSMWVFRLFLFTVHWIILKKVRTSAVYKYILAGDLSLWIRQPDNSQLGNYSNETQNLICTISTNLTGIFMWKWKLLISVWNNRGDEKGGGQSRTNTAATWKNQVFLRKWNWWPDEMLMVL